MNAFQKVTIIFIIVLVGFIIASLIVGDEKILQLERDFFANTELNYIMPETKVEVNYNTPKYLVEKQEGTEPDSSLGYKNYSFVNDNIHIELSAPKDFVLDNTNKSLQGKDANIYIYVEPIPDKYDLTYTYQAFVNDYLKSKYAIGEKSQINGEIDEESFFDNDTTTTYFFYKVKLTDQTDNYFLITTCDNNIVTIQYKIDEKKEIDTSEIINIFKSTEITIVEENDSNQ